MGITGIGLSEYDIALLLLCPFGALLGSFAFMISATIRTNPPVKENEYSLASKKLMSIRGRWMALRFMLGAIMGLLLGLYFVGAIQETPSTLAKVIALSIIAGYAAPKLWDAQDELITNQIKKVVKEELSQNSGLNDDTPNEDK